MLRSRYNRILWFFGGLLFNLIWWDIFLPRIGLRNLAQRTRTARLRRFAASFRVLAIRMGGVMIKVGQFLSARLDVLPREFTDELSGLQDEVRPESFADIRKVLDSEFNRPIEEMFTNFQTEPLASASIGQVYRARIGLPDAGEVQEVVVKVQRPNIEMIVAVDLSALRIVSRWIDLYPPIRRRVSMPALMEEFSASLYEEIDYLQEGRNAEIFAKNFKDQPDIQIPHVFWSHTTRRVLTLEHIQAIKITDYAAIEAAGIQRTVIAERLFNTYFQQIFEDRFFHADPHPGNLFVLPQPVESDPAAFRLVFVDFGMVGTLSEKLLSGLRELLIAAGTQDATRLVRAYQQMEILLPGADIELIQRASAEAFSRFWGRTAPEMAAMDRKEIARFMQEFSEILYDLPFQVPENFILLGRCMGILSGICSGLDKDFNLWQQVMPYARKLIETQRKGGLDFVVREAGDLLRVAVGLPRKTDELITRLEQGKVSIQTPEIKQQMQRVNTNLRRLTSAVMFSALFLGGIQLYLGGLTLPAYAAGGVGLLALVLVLIGR